MRTYQTTETTTLLDYQRESNGRNRMVFVVMYSLLAAALVAVGVLVIGGMHHGGHASFSDIGLLGTGRNRLLDLNSEPTVAPAGCDATIMLIRHCDKAGPLIQDDQSDQHCSYVGFQRAHYISTLFGSRWPKPSKLYALHPGRRGHANFREVETLEPLARTSNVTINDHFTTHHTRRDANEIFAQLRSGELCGKLVVICWKHSHMSQLARALGWVLAPSHYPKSSFDQVWQIKYVYQPPVLYAVDHKAHKKKAKKSHKAAKKEAKHKREMEIASDGWVLYGSVEYQHFDALSYSYKSGDYPEGGKATGAGWANVQPEL